MKIVKTLTLGDTSRGLQASVKGSTLIAGIKWEVIVDLLLGQVRHLSHRILLPRQILRKCEDQGH
jgi:hypothetical protein